MGVWGWGDAGGDSRVFVLQALVIKLTAAYDTLALNTRESHREYISPSSLKFLECLSDNHPWIPCKAEQKPEENSRHG